MMSKAFRCVWVAVLALVLAASAQVASGAAQASESDPEGDPGLLRMHDARTAFTATPLPDGTMLIAGGHDGAVFHRSAELFDPESRLFRRVGDMVTPRYGHRATALPDGRVVLTGGAMDGNPRGQKSVEVYDPATGSFSPLGRLQHGRFAHTATLLDDGTVLIAGGLRDGGKLSYRKSAEVFDPATGTSRSIAPMRRGRMMHAAVPLEDGRIAMIGGFGAGGAGERTLEVYAPAGQRFLRRPDLVAPVDRPAAVRLDDGRVLVASRRSVVIAPDARDSELVLGGSRVHAGATATLLEDGRVVIVAGGGAKPGTVDLFDPATDLFMSGERLRSNRVDQVAVGLDDGTVMIVGGFSLGSDCVQVLDTAEIWDPRSMSTVAAAAQAECQPHVEASLPPLGAETTGGRIEMPRSAFAITVPDDWSVELAEPDVDVSTAEPGSAWEALRATAPDDSLACSVSVGVSKVSLRKRSGTGSGGVLVPRWDPARRWLLLVPTPRVKESATSFSSSSPIVRLARKHEGLEHDALYALECAGHSEAVFESIHRSFEFLPVPAE